MIAIFHWLSKLKLKSFLLQNKIRASLLNLSCNNLALFDIYFADESTGVDIVMHFRVCIYIKKL